MSGETVSKPSTIGQWLTVIEMTFQSIELITTATIVQAIVDGQPSKNNQTTVGKDGSKHGIRIREI
jgi:hypothetical protein